MSSSSNNNNMHKEEGPQEQMSAAAVTSSAAYVSNDNLIDTDRQKDPSKDTKKKKRKKKKPRDEKALSLIGAVEDGGVEEDGKGDGGGRKRLLRAPSVGNLPPPHGFSLSKEKRRDVKALQIDDKYDLPSRPGAMRVRRLSSGDVDIEVGGPSLTRTGSSNKEDLGGGGNDDELTSSPCAGDIMAQAELVNHPAVVVEAAPDTTADLHDRIRMLEADKADREGGDTNSSKRILCAFALFLVLAGVTVGIIVSLVGKGSPIPTEAPSRAPTPQPSPYPTLLPTGSPTQFPTPFPTVDVEELWTSLIQSNSPTTTFDNDTTPEYRALEWMVEDPFTKSLFNATDRVLQRFALALFWYATGATIGGGWLSDTTECNWGGTSLRCDFNDTIVGMTFGRLGVTGTIPKEMGLLSALNHLALDGNSFEGTIPSEIGKLTELTELDLQYTDLEGSIPSEIGLLTDLHTIYLGKTSVHGPVPTEIGMLSSMELFALYDNKFLNGTLPSEIGLMTSVTLLDVAGNALTGTIPSEVANLTNLESFQMYSNKNISGTMPSSLCAGHRDLSIDCGEGIECTCCKGPWPNFVPCEDNRTD